MNEKLNNIFVSLQVAKLAQDKKFNEWCACWWADETGEIANSDDSYEWDYNASSPAFIKIPTHYQLIDWLAINHEIDIPKKNGLWRVLDAYGDYIRLEDNTYEFYTINEALIIALNQIE